LRENPALYKPNPMSHIPPPMAILSILLTVILVAVSILIVLIVLVQRPKQEGLGAAFGGGTLDSALGADTTDVLKKTTTYLGVIFFLSAVGLAMVKTRQFKDSASSDLLDAVESRETEMPFLPPELMNLPDLEDFSAPDSLPETGALPESPETTPEAPAAPEGEEAPTAPEPE